MDAGVKLERESKDGGTRIIEYRIELSPVFMSNCRGEAAKIRQNVIVIRFNPISCDQKQYPPILSR